MNELRFGKHPPKKDYRAFLFQTYLKDDIPDPPLVFEALDRVHKATLEPNPEFLFPMYANDRLGDCVIAAMAHSDTVFRGWIGQKYLWDEALVIKVYFHLTGGVDSGLALLDTLKYFKNNVVAGDKIAAYVSVNPHNHQHVKQAISLFGGLLVGFQVQEKAVEDFRNKIAWTPGKMTYNGHCIYATGYDMFGVNTLTWGSTQKGTWAWWDACVDEAFVVLDNEARDEKFAPGFDFELLKKDLIQIADW